MARMIPAEPRSFHGSTAEEDVFAALRSLAPDVTVFHSVHWVREGPTAGRPMGEADFVVLDPRWGLLFLEVKGGRIRLEAGQWQQLCAGAGWKPIDPEEQARHSMHTLRRRITARLPSGDRCPCAHAVWFPHVEAPRVGLPPNLAPAMLLDERSLRAPAAAVQATFEHWGFGEARLSEAGRRRVLDVLAPTLDLAPTLQAECDARERRFVQLTEEQARILDFLEAQRVATIAGAAGTGKTLLAMEKARRLGADGGRVAFLCYNATLRSVLQRAAPSSGVDYHTFHSLGRRFAGQENEPFAAQAQAFLEYLAGDDNDWPYEHVVIDEGQDFESDWIQWLKYRTRGTFYVFYDRHQLVQQARLPAWIEEAECRLTLHRNCRNTTQIARMAWRTGNLPPARAPDSVDGPRPVLHEYAGREALVRRVRDLVVRLRREGLAPEDIAILSLLGTSQAALAAVPHLAEIPLAEEPRAGAICRTTVRKFKGLEAKVVVLTDVDFAQLVAPEMRRLLYVGCSRARHALHLFVPTVDDGQVAALLQILAPDRRLLASRRMLAEQLAAEWEAQDAAQPKQRE